jgi:hypothetical protein
MRRMIMLFTVAAVMAVIMVALAASAFANCGDAECSVGAAGTGGEKSEGKAQGFRTEGPGHNPGVSVTNTGNSFSGQLKVDRPGDDDTQLAGTGRDGIARGRSTGEFGEWSGQCAFEDIPCE